MLLAFQLPLLRIKHPQKTDRREPNQMLLEAEMKCESSRYGGVKWFLTIW